MRVPPLTASPKGGSQCGAGLPRLRLGLASRIGKAARAYASPRLWPQLIQTRLRPACATRFSLSLSRAGGMALNDSSRERGRASGARKEKPRDMVARPRFTTDQAGVEYDALRSYTP